MPLLDDLVAYWKFDDAPGGEVSDVYADAAGSHDFTVTGDTVVDGTGILNNGVEFDGTNAGELVATDHADLRFGNTAWTIAGWVKTSQAVLRAYIIKSNVGSDGEFALFVSPDDPVISARIFDGGANIVALLNATDINGLGQWNFFCAWFDGADAHLQVNDATPVDVTPSDTPGTGTANLVLNDNNNAIGILDEIGKWSRALTVDERAELYNAGAGLSFDEFTATPAAASTPNTPINIPLLLHRRAATRRRRARARR